jgi:hypothetical protein
LLVALAIIEFSAPATVLAVVPAEGQVLPNGSFVEGNCEEGVNAGGEEEYKYWILRTVDPQRKRKVVQKKQPPPELAPAILPPQETSAAADTAGMLIQAGTLQFGSAIEAGNSFYSRPHSLPSGGVVNEWGWDYGPGWAWNLQGGAGIYQFTGLPVGACTEGAVNTVGPFGEGVDFGAFLGDVVPADKALLLNRPGPYVLEQLVYTEARGPRAQPCGQQTCPPEPPPEACPGILSTYVGFWFDFGLGTKFNPRDSIPLKYCAKETSATKFYVLGSNGGCPQDGDMSQWPNAPYINQYDAGERLGLEHGSEDPRPGAPACGASSLMMGMLNSLARQNKQKPAAWWPRLKDVYDNTVLRPTKDFSAAKGAVLLKGMGWKDARARDFLKDQASIADAGPPYPILYPNPTNEAAIDLALQNGPVEVSTAFGGVEWGKMGAGHMILIVGIDPQQPGEYIVDDPAGNYFSSPKHHYGPGSCGYEVRYPKAWVLAYTTGRQFLEFGPYSGNDPLAINIQDAEPGGPRAPSSFYLQNGAGQRTGWINGEAVNELPHSYAAEDEPWPQDVSGGDPEVEPEPEPEPTGPFPRYLSIAEPEAGVTLHVVAGSSGEYALSAEAGDNGIATSSEELKGASGPGQDTVIASPTLQSTLTQPLSITPPLSGTSAGSSGASVTSSTSSQGGTPHTVTAGVTAAEVRALLLTEIIPSGKGARSAAILKRGGFALTFRALESGTAIVDWYELPPGAKLARKTRPKQVLVAAGRLTFQEAGTSSLNMSLTPAGKQLLRHQKAVRLTATGAFAHSGSAPVRATRSFVLRG